MRLYELKHWMEMIDKNRKNESRSFKKECMSLGTYLITEKWYFLKNIEIETIILYLLKLDSTNKLKKHYPYLNFIFKGKNLEKTRNSSVFLNLSIKLFNELSLNHFHQFIFKYIFSNLFSKKNFAEKRIQNVNDMLLDVYLSAVFKISAEGLENDIYCFKKIFSYITKLLFKNFENYDNKPRFQKRFMIPVLETLRRCYKIKNNKDYFKLTKMYYSVLTNITKTDFMHENSSYLKDYVIKFGNIVLEKISEMHKDGFFSKTYLRNSTLMFRLEEFLFKNIEYPVEIKCVFCNLYLEFLKVNLRTDESVLEVVFKHYVLISNALENDKLEFWLIFIPFTQNLMKNDFISKSKLEKVLNYVWEMVKRTYFSAYSTKKLKENEFALLCMFTFLSWGKIHMFKKSKDYNKKVDVQNKTRKIIWAIFCKKFASCKILHLLSVTIFFFQDINEFIYEYKINSQQTFNNYMSIYTNFMDILLVKSQKLVETNTKICYTETDKNSLWKFDQNEFNDVKLSKMITDFTQEIVYKSNKPLSEHLIFI